MAERCLAGAGGGFGEAGGEETRKAEEEVLETNVLAGVKISLAEEVEDDGGAGHPFRSGGAKVVECCRPRG